MRLTERDGGDGASCPIELMVDSRSSNASSETPSIVERSSRADAMVSCPPFNSESCLSGATKSVEMDCASSKAVNPSKSALSRKRIADARGGSPDSEESSRPIPVRTCFSTPTCPMRNSQFFSPASVNMLMARAMTSASTSGPVAPISSTPYW